MRKFGPARRIGQPKQAQDYALLWRMREGNGQRERGGSGTEPKSRVGLGCQSKTIGDNDLLHITTMMEQYGSLQYTTRRSQEYIDAALVNLAPFENSSAKRSLTVVANYMVHRDR